MENPKAEVLGGSAPASAMRERASGPAAAARLANDLALPVGYRLFEYRIDTVLGQGGFGIAYKATDVNLAAKVVVKEYMPETFAARAADYSVGPRDAADREFYVSGLESFLSEART